MLLDDKALGVAIDAANEASKAGFDYQWQLVEAIKAYLSAVESQGETSVSRE